ncbi:MAG: hypothetical protein U1F98_15555 [Verrucomicrobiota bacterium]
MENHLDQIYVTGIHEIIWGCLLVAVTLAFHGFGMLTILRTMARFKAHFQKQHTLVFGLLSIVLTSWMIIVVHLLEVFSWAGFFIWKDAVSSPNANASLAYYLALMDYTTLGCNFNLVLRWRLLEGMIAIAGLLTFAWSTGVMLTLAQQLQDEYLQRFKPKAPAGKAQSSGSSKATE